jgi:hypothetical protein
VLPVETDQFPDLQELLAWDPDEEAKEYRRLREARVKVRQRVVRGEGGASRRGVGRERARLGEGEGEPRRREGG